MNFRSTRQLASYPRQNGVAAALRELGRLERTLFTLDWLEDPGLRRQTSRELNKGESRHGGFRAAPRIKNGFLIFFFYIYEIPSCSPCDEIQDHGCSRS